MYQIKKFIFSIALIILTVSCAQTDTVTKETSISQGNAPEWYNMSGFNADSLSFSSFATAIASDSLEAISRAENQAKAVLENHIAERMEAIRTDLEETGSMNAIDPNFILTLRNAHAQVEDNAEVIETTAVKEETSYRGFAQASISKEDVVTLLQSGFEGNTHYWEELSSSEMFTIELRN